MKKLLFTFFLLVGYNCYPYEITVYGSYACGYTTAMRNELTAKNITFTFCEVSTGTCMGEMLKFSTDYNLLVDGTIYYPIVKVVVDGITSGFSRPDIKKIQKLIEQTIIKEVSDPRVYYDGRIIYVSDVRGVDLYNMMGMKILHSANDINISSLPTGIYICNGIKILKTR